MTPPASASTDLSPRAHLDGADANAAFGRALADAHPQDPVVVGWAVTALFYAAVHEARAYLVARHGRRIVAHDDMRAVWSAHPEMQPGRVPYTELKQQSESARYYLNRAFSADDFAFLETKYARIRALLRAGRSHDASVAAPAP
jgi:hypothetical protein